MDDICLYDFVANYNYYGYDNHGNRKYTKLQKPRLPNHKIFDPNKEDEREDYYYSLILLFVPFRDESTLVLQGETAEQAFQRLVLQNEKCSAHHEKLDNARSSI